MCDWLDDEVPERWLAELLNLVRKCQNLDWLLLTKRPENWEPRIVKVLDMLEAHPHFMDLANDSDTVALRNWLADWYVLKKAPANIWMGTTVENQKMADKRIPELLKIPAKVRFLSCEPLLGLVKFKIHHWPIDWIICGGESGPNARPMHPDWARSLRDQCEAARVPFLFKQWGEWLGGEQDGAPGDTQHLNCTQEPIRIGKKAAGRLLDGKEHSAFPEAKV